MTKIDEYSLAAIPVEQRRGEMALGDASAFIWAGHGKYYLITNWHVVMMVNPYTGENLHKQGARPTALRALLNPERMVWDKIALEIPLYDPQQRPLWLVHSVYGKKVDVVAIPLPSSAKGARYYPINTLAREPELAAHIGMDVFVLGYPFGSPFPAFPVWKRGSIATEPQLAPLADKYVLIDSASRPGMSGAPVIRRAWGAYLKDDGGVSMTAAAVTRFLGVYSGRLHTKNPLDAQLGILWPDRFIEEIVATSTRDPGE